jgi:hypothetical protein
MKFIEHFISARRVSTPLVAIHTHDSASTVESIRASVTDADGSVNVPLIMWDASRGFTALTSAGQAAISTALAGIDPDAVNEIPDALRVAGLLGEDCILFIANAQMFWSSHPVSIQAIFNLRDPFKSRGCMLVLLMAPGGVLPAELTNDVLVLAQPLPDATAIESIIASVYTSAECQQPDAETVSRAVNALIGLPAFPCEQTIAMCLDTVTGGLNMPEMWNRKRSIIAQTPGLSVWGGSETLDGIGGLQPVKTFLRQVMTGRANRPSKVKTIIFIDEIEKHFAGSTSDTSGVKQELTGSMLTWMQDTRMLGFLSLGIPGVCKSMLAKSLGGSYGIPVISFDLAGMQSGIVGSSGANLRTAQLCVDAISGNEPGSVLCIATCNSVDALPAELRSRFKLATYFFDSPDATEKPAIWGIHRTRFNIDPSDVNPVDNGWTGREIEECCNKADMLGLSLVDAASYVVPITVSAATRIRALRQSASGCYLSASYPGLYQYSEDSQPLPVNAVSTARKIRSN